MAETSELSGIAIGGAIILRYWTHIIKLLSNSIVQSYECANESISNAGLARYEPHPTY